MTYPEKQKTILTKKGVELKAPRHYDASKKKEYTNTLRQPMVVASNRNIIHTDKKWKKLFYGTVLDYARDYFGLHDVIIELKFRNETLNTKKGQVNLSDTKNIIIIEDGGIESNISFILHEFTHIKQKIRNESAFEKRNNKWMILWRGQPVLTKAEYTRIYKSDNEYKRYKELPWEAEAIDTSKKVSDFMNSTFAQSLAGKDPTIDYIFQNRQMEIK